MWAGIGRQCSHKGCRGVCSVGVDVFVPAVCLVDYKSERDILEPALAPGLPIICEAEVRKSESGHPALHRSLEVWQIAVVEW